MNMEPERVTERNTILGAPLFQCLFSGGWL